MRAVPGGCDERMGICELRTRIQYEECAERMAGLPPHSPDVICEYCTRVFAERRTASDL